MRRHLRHAGGARGQQYPFRLERCGGKPWHSCDLGRAFHADRQRERGISGRVAIGNNSIDLRSGEQRAKMRRLCVGRQDRQAARDAVELDQRQGGRELTAGGNSDRFPRQFRESAAEACSIPEVHDAGDGAAIPEKTVA